MKALHVSCAVVGWLLALVGTMTGAVAATAAALEFNVATYNLRLNTPDDGPNAWPLRKDAARELIRYREIDLLGTFNDFKIDAPLKDRIDYIFLGPGWRVLRYAALTDSTGGRFPSDHLPVVARLARD